jgi:Na+/H+ antiporter NhaD/arsenite permease-like protein
LPCSQVGLISCCSSQYRSTLGATPIRSASRLVNLDVAVVVAMPVALETAARQRMPAGRLAVAVAVTANAASFLLPASNITSLLLLSRVPLPPLAYLRGSWLAWLLVVAVTIGPLSGWLASAGAGAAGVSRASGASPVSRARPSARAALDLIPMFAAASAIRAILAAGIVLRGGLAAQLAAGSAVTAVASNLPAAAALRPAGWSAVLATAIGPGLVITGSVATLIRRRIARDAGAKLRALQFSLIGSALLPAQLAAAVIGLHLTGALR